MLKQEYIDQFYKQEKWNLFNHPKWWDAVTENWDILSVEYKSEKIFLPISIETKWGVKMLRNPHLIPYLVPLSRHKWSNEEKTEIANKLLENLPSVDVLNIDFSPEYIPSNVPKSMNNLFKKTNYLDLKPGKEVYNVFKPALKRQIKKAERNLLVSEEDNIEAFIELHRKTFEKQKSKALISANIYVKAWKVAQELNCGKLFFINDDKKNKQAALFWVHDSETGYYLAGGTDAQFYGSGAMSKLMWHAIEESIQMGKDKFDFEGSMLPNVNRFFQNFCPDEISYSHLLFNRSTLYSIHQKLKKLLP